MGNKHMEQWTDAMATPDQPAVFDLGRLKKAIQEKINIDDPEAAASCRLVIENRKNHLKDKYSDYLTYQAYFALSPGEPVPATAQKGDFPGDDSVTEFITNL